MRIKNYLQVVSSTPYDTSTSEGRALERRRRIVLTSLVSIMASAISVGAGLISVPLTFRYLSLESFGMWAAISSLMGVLQFADLGLGNGIKSSVAKASASDDVAEIRKFVSNGYILLTVTSIALAILFVFAYPFVTWSSVLNVTSEIAISEAGSAVFAFVMCLLVSIPFTIVSNVQIGLQQGYESALWRSGGAVCSLLAISLCIYYHGSIVSLVFCYFGAPLIPAFLNTLIFFSRNRCIIPKVTDFSFIISRDLLSTGMLFLILQMAVAVTFSLDAILISQALGPVAVAQYAIPDKLLSLIPMLVSIGLSPLWPAYSEAIARNDHGWVRGAFKRSLLFTSAIGGGMGSLLFFTHSFIFAVWVPSYTGATYLLVGLIALWRCVESIGFALSMYLNGVRVFALQASIAVITAVAAVAAKYVLLRQVGLIGVPIGTMVCYGAFTLIPSAIWIIRRLFANRFEPAIEGRKI